VAKPPKLEAGSPAGKSGRLTREFAELIPEIPAERSPNGSPECRGDYARKAGDFH